MEELRIVVAGAAGRMGRTVLRAISESGDCILAGAIARSSSPEVGREASLLASADPGLLVTDDAVVALRKADAIVDFSTPQSSIELAELAASMRVPHIIGTTGFSPEQETQIANASERTAIVKSGNMSLGIALLSSLVKQAAAALQDFDIEILDMHHGKKVDAPSGTSLLLGRSAAKGRNVELNQISDLHGQRNAARGEGTIGFASLRGGTVVGEHQVIFAGPHERVVLSHIAEDRIIFARGALAAARWSQDKPAGLYDMQNVLGAGIP
ncbi:MAG TPA: 4-hydroxy-tetrahydrodipicolinate reductase [Rhizomicrobium sp.]|jgi:4-hydroxy-tetrahydrodipicolinate reductase|nr:4-hydroxy-tetrahydrodipicolinate reductase [Rhizomicrobium sp.]